MDLASLANKNLLLGISGSIAAYKACELLRLYQQQGANTRVLMTRQAQEFITPLTLQGLSGHEVHTDLVDYAAENAMGHIQLARWADCLIIAPASAAVLARLAGGDASDLLSAVFLATTAPRLLAPAMNKEMWAKSVTQANLAKLAAQADTQVVQPGDGWQACGEIGAGRLADLEDIVHTTAACFSNTALAGKKVLITAGPTREPLDAARFLSNYSSGKMGYALAAAAALAGGTVTLVSGPVTLEPPPHCDLLVAETAQQMLAACEMLAGTTDIFIAAAAVADWRPKSTSSGKLAKQDLPAALPLTANPDILVEVAKLLPATAVTVGFAAQTDNLAENALKKLKAKGVDLLCANLLEQAFAADSNEILLLFATGKQQQLPLQSKTLAARQIIKEAAALLAAKGK